MTKNIFKNLLQREQNRFYIKVDIFIVLLFKALHGQLRDILNFLFVDRLLTT